MAVTYYVALPFVRTEDGVAPGEAQAMPNDSAAIRRAAGGSNTQQKKPEPTKRSQLLVAEKYWYNILPLGREVR
jgi:hypothetical protein